MLYLCDLCGLARKIPRDSCSSLAKPYGFFSQSRRVYWAAELLLLRIRERRETFGLEGSSQRCTMLSPHKAEGPSAVSASHTYHLCGSINSAALREKFDNRGLHRVYVTLYHQNILASAWLSIKVFLSIKKWRSQEMNVFHRFECFFLFLSLYCR